VKSLTDLTSFVKSTSVRKWLQQNEYRTQLFFVVDNNVIDEPLDLTNVT